MEANMPQPTAQRQQPSHDTRPTSRAGQKPVDKFRENPVHVSIWENQGVKGAVRSASIELRYKDSNEEWQTGHSYGPSDLQHLESAAREARTRIETWLRTRRDNPAANAS
jgi:hypothetical protein